MRSLSGARVWLTGASSGIGEALVPPLLRRGARVAVSARRAERLEALTRMWRANGGEVLVVPLDATDRPAVLAAARRIEEAWGGIDVAIFNAGTHTPSTSDGFDSAQFVDTMTLNYFGVIYGIEAVLPAMLARGSGHIVGVASLAGYRALPRAPAYGASKAALILALDSIRFDLEPRGITVTTVNPGFVKTPLTDKNTFKMPFLMDVEDAAAIMVRDIERQKRESHFPVPFSWMLKLLRILPFPLYRLLILRGTRGQQRARRSVIGDLSTVRSLRSAVVSLQAAGRLSTVDRSRRPQTERRVPRRSPGACRRLPIRMPPADRCFRMVLVMNEMRAATRAGVRGGARRRRHEMAEIR